MRIFYLKDIYILALEMARITGRVHLGEHRRSARQTADEPG